MSVIEQNALDTHTLRAPAKLDGCAIHELVRACPPLDVNSLYCYLLLCEHFSATCIVAESAEGEIDGFVSAYIPPGRPDCLFVWQLAVHERARGQRLALRMLNDLLSREALHNIAFVETTVGPDNAESRSTFAALAQSYEARLVESELFPPALFGAQAHEDERLLRIGTLKRA